MHDKKRKPPIVPSPGNRSQNRASNVTVFPLSPDDALRAVLSISPEDAKRIVASKPGKKK